MNILLGFKLHTKIKFKNWILQVWVVRERVNHSPLNNYPKKGVVEGRMMALAGWSPPSHSVVSLQHLQIDLKIESLNLICFRQETGWVSSVKTVSMTMTLESGCPSCHRKPNHHCRVHLIVPMLV